MWREYTKETPARPGWAIVGTAMALASTTALAYITVNRSAPTGVGTPARVSIPGWPISFALPRGFDSMSPDEGEIAVSPEGTFGDLHSVHSAGRRGAAIFTVRFKVENEDVNLTRAFAKWSGQSAADAEPISVGPLKGLAAETTEMSGITKYTAAAVVPAGLIIVIEEDTPGPSSRYRRQFEAVCESVQFKPWFVRNRDKQPWLE